jgi:hypothetical protein
VARGQGTFPEAPVVEVALIDNAIYDATGVRMREVPFGRVTLWGEGIKKTLSPWERVG